MMKVITKKERMLLVRSFSFIKAYKSQITVYYFISIVSCILELIPSYIMGRIIDFTISKDFQQVINQILILVGIFVITTALSFFETYLSSLLKNKITFSIKNIMFERIVYLPKSFFDKMRAGDYISRVEGDTSNVANFYIDTVLQIIVCCIKICVSFYFMVRITLTMSLIALSIFPITLLINVFFSEKIKKITQELRGVNDNYMSFFSECLMSIRELKVMSIEGKIKDKFNSFSKSFIHFNMNATKISALGGVINLSVSSISDWLLIGYGCWSIIANKLTVGSYVSFNMYTGIFSSSIKSIVSMNVVIKNLTVCLERVYELLDAEIEADNAEYELQDVQGLIRIGGLSFKYEQSVENVLSDLSLEIKPNSITAIVGQSGCGKSTLMDILISLYKNYQGSIYIDSIEVKDIKLASLRKNIAYIQQKPFIYNATIKENLMLANDNSTDEEIQEACELVNLDSFVKGLPKKYDTLIGANGINLSGGQAQRLAIARAILKKSKIILLDEITSDLDGISESVIVDALEKLMDRHTIVIISHRLSSIRNVPNIYVMKNGQIVSSGNHEYLIQECNVYSELFANQVIYQTKIVV